jgi:hypothetical protein
MQNDNQAKMLEYKLGELLHYSGWISLKDVRANLTISRFMGLPLSTLLITQGVVTREQLKVALRLQALVASQMLALAVAAMALRDLRLGACSAQELLSSLNDYSHKAGSCLLGEILIDAGMVSDVVLGRALVKGAESEKPLGEVLVEQSIVSRDFIDAALKMQSRVRSFDLEYNSGIAELKCFPASVCAAAS